MRSSHRTIGFLLTLCLAGCVSVPPDIFRLPANSLAMRQLQTRQYATTDEKKIVTSSAGVLQDLGFTLDESETKLGLILGSKDRNATEGSQVALATLAVAAAAFAGTYSNAYQTIDKVQKLKACVVTRLSEDKSKVLVRVTFQRIVWNAMGAINHVDTLNEPQLYEDFFERLSKAIFLEEQKI